MIIWDIETEALPLDEIQGFMPEMPAFDPSTVPGIVTGEFNPASVKLGNTKDEAKIAAKIEEARAAHEAAKANAANLIAQAKADHAAKIVDLKAEFIDRAALSATTGRILCIGYLSLEKNKFVIDHGDGEETKILTGFWSQYQKCRQSQRKMVGLNIYDFDLPFIARRSWILGIDVPATVFDGRYLDRIFVDLRKQWLFGQYGAGTKSDFDTLGKAFGTGGKNGQSGADFSRLWHEDRAAAIAYLESDLRQPAAWAARMGLI